MEKRYDLIIAGAGPAGLAAAIYMSRAKYRVLVIEKDTIGGQITITSEIVNYPGVRKISGKELTQEMRQQAEDFGAEFIKAKVTDIKIKDYLREVVTTAGNYGALSVLIAAGANPRKLGFAGESEYQGRGIAYCATCDGEFFTGKDVFVIGGGFAAAEEAVFLTRYAKQVTVVMRGKDFSCAATVADEVKKHPQIQVCYETEVLEAGGEQMLKYVKFRDKKSGEVWEHRDEGGFGIFVFAGYVPATEVFKDTIALDERGYILTDQAQKTNVDGIYAAGDICVKELRQVVTAVADGALAATAMEKYVSGIYEKYQLAKLERKQKKAEQTQEVQEESGFLSAEIRIELKKVFVKFPNPVVLKYMKDERKVSAEVKDFLEELSELTEKIILQEESDSAAEAAQLPTIMICNVDGAYSGIQFHGIPGGHEFNSFIMALYQAAGGGAPLADDMQSRIRQINKKTNIKIVVSLSCTMCPGLVMEAQRLATPEGNVEVEIFDLAHYPELKERYHIMSVPCMIIDDEKISFGKKELPEILDLLNV